MSSTLAQCAAVLLVAGAALGEEQPGVSDRSILFGQSAAFSGPVQELGRNMRLGMQTAFREVNEQGGVHGRRLELVSLDDGYEPEAAIDNTRQLIEGERVFALIGAVGTPTSRAAVPIAEDAGVPYIAPFTGSNFLRDPKWRGVVNLRASYYQETEELVARLTDDLGIERIAIMYQDDSFGREGFHGVRRALERRELSLVAVGVYPRNTKAVKTALLDLRSGHPQAVILIGTYQPVATLIAWAQTTSFNPIFVTISFVGSKSLGAGTWPRRHRGHSLAGRALPHGQRTSHSRLVPPRPHSLRPESRAELCLVRGLPSRPLGHRRPHRLRPGGQSRLPIRQLAPRRCHRPRWVRAPLRRRR